MTSIMKEILSSKRCSECEWSKFDPSCEHMNRCYHPSILKDDVRYLSDNYCLSIDNTDIGVDCREERSKKFFGKCGKRGKLFVAFGS